MRHTIELKPFTIPNFVLPVRTVPINESAESIPLRELSAETLAELCDRFRADVFAKAGKLDPKAPVNVDAMIDAVRKAGG